MPNEQQEDDGRAFFKQCDSKYAEKESILTA